MEPERLDRARTVESSAACRVWAAYSLSSEAPIPLPGNNPAIVPATVAAIPGLPFPAVAPCKPPAMPPSPRAGYPLHPMAAGHAAGQKQGQRLPRSPSGAAKAVLSPSSLPPERPRPHSLRGAPGSREGRGPVVQFPRLWAGARGDAWVCKCSGFNLRDVFPTGCVAGRAEGAARSPGRGLRRGAELDRSRPQPVVDGVERFDQLVVPWILRIE